MPVCRSSWKAESIPKIKGPGGYPGPFIFMSGRTVTVADVPPAPRYAGLGGTAGTAPSRLRQKEKSGRTAAVQAAARPCSLCRSMRQAKMLMAAAALLSAPGPARVRPDDQGEIGHGAAQRGKGLRRPQDQEAAQLPETEKRYHIDLAPLHANTIVKERQSRAGRAYWRMAPCGLALTGPCMEQRQYKASQESPFYGGTRPKR